MADQDNTAVTLYNTQSSSAIKKNSFSIKVGLVQMLRGGVIALATNPDQAKIAESAGACCIAVAEPQQTRGRGMISRMPDPALVKRIKQSVSVPIMSRSRVGHFVEAMILESLDVDYIDESEELAVADEDHFINKHNFRVPFVCGCTDLGEAFRRVREGAAMVRIQGDLSGSGDVVRTVSNVRSVLGDIRKLANMDEDEVFTFAKNINAPYDIVAQTKQMGRLPVVQFASGGIATPADAAMMMQLGCDGVFLGSDVFDCSDPYNRIRSIVQAVRHYSDPQILVDCYYSGLADAMGDLNLDEGGGVEQIES